jgi:hypothetical protein
VGITGKRVLPGHDAGDDLLLDAAEGGEAEGGFQDFEGVSHGSN